MTRIRVRDVEVRTEVALTLKEIRSLLRTVAGIAAAFEEPEPESPPIGFSIVTERAPADELPDPYFDDED